MDSGASSDDSKCVACNKNSWADPPKACAACASGLYYHPARATSASTHRANLYRYMIRQISPAGCTGTGTTKKCKCALGAIWNPKNNKCYVKSGARCSKYKNLGSFTSQDCAKRSAARGAKYYYTTAAATYGSARKGSCYQCLYGSGLVRSAMYPYILMQIKAGNPTAQPCLVTKGSGASPMPAPPPPPFVCNPGTFKGKKMGKDACIVCPVNTYQTQERHTLGSCVKCAAGRTAAVTTSPLGHDALDDCLWATCHADHKVGHSDYCTDLCPCAHGEGDCDREDTHTDCMSGLKCIANQGLKYKTSGCSGCSVTTDVCVDPSKTTCKAGGPCTKLCPCKAGKGDCFKGPCASDLMCFPKIGAKFGLAASASVCIDAGSAPCSTLKSYATGATAYCSANCPCAENKGPCDPSQKSADCAVGLVCTRNTGAYFGLKGTDAMCTKKGYKPPAGGCHGLLKIGSANYCSAACPCAAGEGDCDEGFGECKKGLVCVTDVGAKFGMPKSYDVCNTIAFAKQANDDPCFRAPCLNGGKCAKTGTEDYRCTCTSATYYGKDCSLVKPPPPPAPLKAAAADDDSSTNTIIIVVAIVAVAGIAAAVVMNGGVGGEGKSVEMDTV